MPCSPLLITPPPAFVFDEQHTVLTRDTMPNGERKNAAAAAKLIQTLRGSRNNSFSRLRRQRLVQLSVLGQLRHSRIDALTFAILVDSAGFRFADSATGGAHLCPLQREPFGNACGRCRGEENRIEL